MDFIKLIKNQYDAKVKTINTDNGIMPTLYSSKWIIHQISYVEPPQ